MSEQKKDKKTEALETLEQADRVLSEIYVKGDGVTMMAQARLLLKKAYENVKEAGA